MENADGGMLVAEPSDAAMCKLLGSHYYQGNCFTVGQIQALAKFYEFDLPPDTTSLEFSGAYRNLMRHVESDGLRVMAFLAKHRLLEEGKDPVRSLSWAIQQDFYQGTPDIWNELGEDDE